MAKRSRWAPTPQQISDAGKLYGLGMGISRVAAYFGVSEQTFRHAMKKDAAMRSSLEKNEADAIGAVSKSAYEMAISKKHPVMTIFYLKCRGRWREKNFEETEQKGLLDDPNQQATIDRANEVVTEFKGLLEEFKRIPHDENGRAHVEPLPAADYPRAVPENEAGSQ